MSLAEAQTKPKNVLRSRLVVAIATAVTLLAAILIPPPAAQAAGDAQLLVTVQAVHASTGAPITSITSSQTPRRISFRVDFSCVTAACDNAIVKFDPTQLDPNYDFYRLLRRTGFTPPLSGGSVAGSETAGYTVSLGNLPAGASGQFTLEYGWQDLGQSGTTPDRQDFAYANFPDGFPITQTVRGNAETAVGELTATTAPVVWDIAVPDPTISTANLTTPTSGFFATDTNIGYLLRMATGCKNDANRFTYDFQCSSAYTVTHQLPAGAELVSADGNPTVTGDPSTGLVLTWVGPPWAPTGSTSLVGWAANPRAITITFPRANVAPAGQACGFTTTFSGPTGRVDATYISMPGTPGVEKTATLAPSGPFPLKCSDPFPRASAQPKLTTFDGGSRESATVSPVVIPTGSGTNSKEWNVTVSNTANIFGVAVVTDNTLDLIDLPVYQIVAPAGSTIDWTATDGATTQSGTATGTATAPTGFRFVTSTVTSPRLAPPNQIPEQQFRTDFTVRYLYRVSPGATPGTAGHTNTASALMEWPDYPQFADTSLTITPHTVNLIAPFARMASMKYADTFLVSPIGSSRFMGQNIDVPVPAAGESDRILRWNAIVANTGSAPAVPTVVDTHLGDNPEMPITQIIAGIRVGNPPPAIASGTLTQNVPFTAQVLLDDGTTGTYNGTLYNAPAGRRIMSATVTGPTLDGANVFPTTNTSRQLEVYFQGRIPTTATRDTYTTNTFDGRLDYAISGLGVLTGGGTSTVHLVGVPPTITAMFGPTTIAGGASTATTTTDVTFRVGGSTMNVASDRALTPEYVFMAPAAWNITPGSASFPAGSVPAGVQFTYRTVTVAGVPRQVAVASWPAGAVFGKNTTLPNMSVIARPTAAAPAGTVSVARGFITNTNDPLPVDIFTSEFTDTPDIDGNPATVRFSEAIPPASVPVGSVAAMQVLKEICFPDASQPDGCRWFADPNNTVGVPPNSTSIKYRISVTNTGNTALSDVVGYDVLPYIGDTGTSDPTGSSPRGSTFQETINSVTTPTNGATATYSDATQPCRAEVDSTVPGCIDDWDASPAGAQSIRLAKAGTLAAGESISMMYDAAVVNAPGFGAKACNSFAVKATGLSNVSEPAPVCASIEETDLQIVAGTPQLQDGRPGLLPWTVTNNGGAPSTQGEVKVAIPAGVDVTSFTPAGWLCTAVDGNGTPVFGTAVGPATLTCIPNSPLLLGVSQALNIPVRPTTTSELTITADVSGRMFDAIMPNNDDVMSVTPTAAAGDIGVTKTDGVATARPGDTLTYTITVGNPLDFETLTGGTLTDVLPSRVAFVSASDGGTEAGGVVTWALPDIPAQGSLPRTVTVRVSSTINTAELLNTARVSVPDPANAAVPLTGSAEDRDTVITNPAITISKGSLLPTYAAVGEVVNYTFTIHNTGDVTLTGVAIADPLPGLSAIAVTWGASGAGMLAPNEQANATAQYTITQADIDAGRVANTATVAGTPPAGMPVTATDTHEVTSTAVPHVTLTKTSASTPTRAADTITYSFVLLNDGALTLRNVAVTDPLPGLSTLIYVWPGEPGVLAPGESVTATATYAVRQSDVDGGEVLNTATGAGETPAGLPVSDDDTFTVTIAQTPTIAFDKDGDYTPGQRGEAGDTINYEFTATNTGNVTLTGVVVADPLPGLSALAYTWPGVVGVLAPGQSVVATATYTVTQADVDVAGFVVNTATVDGVGPGDALVHGEDTVTLQTPADAGIQIVKSGRIEGDAPVQAGDVVRYRFDVTNLGVVTLHDVELADAMVGLSDIELEWPAAEGALAPGSTLVGTASYTLTQADVDAAQVVNTATTQGITPTDEPVADDDTLTIVLTAAAAVTLDKTGTIGEGVWQQGDEVSYRFTITNTGNVTLRDVRVTDPMPGLSVLVYTWPAEDNVLAPGESATATAWYALTGADTVARALTNTATVATDRGATAEDTVTLIGPPPPPPNVGDWLSRTGGGIPIITIGGAMVLLGVGAVLMLIRRRRDTPVD